MRNLISCALAALLAFAPLPAAAQSIGSPAGAATITGSTTLTPTGATTAATIADLAARVRSPLDFGALCDGSTDDAAAFGTAISYLNSNGGGTLQLPPGTCVINSTLVFPNDAGSPIPKQAAIRITGAGEYANSLGATPVRGSILLLGATTGAAKLDTRGVGILYLDHLTLQSTSGAGVPFIQTTNTVLHIEHTTFWGFNSGTSANEDAIVLGGSTTNGDGTATAAFNGYGTVIQSNYFNKVRRAAYFRTYSNASVFAFNTIWNASGSNLASGSAVYLEGGAERATGNYIAGNLIECGNYVYAIRVLSGNNNTIAGNGCFDGTVTTLAAVRIESGGGFNLVIGSIGPTGKPYLSDVGSSTSYLSAAQGEKSTFPNGLTAADLAVFTFGASFTGGGGNPFLVQPATGGQGSAALACIRRSAAEGSLAGTDVYCIDNNGGRSGNGTAAGNYTNSLVSGASWHHNGRGWGDQASARGGSSGYSEDSGTGGSFFDMYNFGVRNFDHTGALQAKFFSTAGGGVGIGWDLGPLGDVSLYRRDATHLETNRVMSALAGVQLPSAAVGSLPTCNAGAEGLEYVATDGAATQTFRATIAAGGSTHYRVTCLSSTWLVGG